MATELITIKTSPKAVDLLRVVAALSGRKQYEVMEQLLEAEKERLIKENNH